jgi:hypothetical protein
MTDNQTTNPIEQAAELAGMGLDIRIEDGKFIIEPSDAGIALLASMQSQNAQSEAAWLAVDELVAEIEKMRNENSEFREVLHTLALLLDNIGYDLEASRINRMLWKVVGIDDEGNEVEFNYFDDNEEGAQ